ncbi:MAG TPA: hypothetical protein DD400_01335 [Rhodospirillaceae bacterium]|nr:hypothetical protein [Rhodospirillaceae bacterium]
MSLLKDSLDFILSHPETMPDPVWFVSLAAGAVLAGTAFIDARTGRVPDFPLLLGLAAMLFASGFYEGQAVLLYRSVAAIISVLVLWLFNSSYFFLLRHDAYGMGDVKWTGLATFIVGLEVVFWAWCLAAWLGLLWMGGRMFLGLFFWQFKQKRHIHFAPFLFISLLVSLYFSS